MAEQMTVEECRSQQRECSGAVHKDISDLRLEVKKDIGDIRDAVQNIDRAVAQIKGYLGLNGNAPQPHHRDNEPQPHLHKRADDAPMGWWKKNWLLITAIILASFAGERVIPFLLKTLGITQ